MPFTELLLAPLLLGMSHSAETDHLVAVGNLVNIGGDWRKEAIRGASWGIGHTVSVLLAAVFFSYLKTALGEPGKWPFEILVGILLLIVGSYKLYKLLSTDNGTTHTTKSAFFHTGLVHGLAGSGAVAVLLSSQASNTRQECIFLALFGLGTIVGMSVISGLLTKLRLLNLRYLHTLSMLVAIVSLVFGLNILIQPFS